DFRVGLYPIVSSVWASQSAARGSSPFRQLRFAPRAHRPRTARCRKLPAAPSLAGVARRTAGAPLDSAAAAARHAPDAPKQRPRRRTLPGPPRSSYSCPRTPLFREHVLMTPTALALQGHVVHAWPV